MRIVKRIVDQLIWTAIGQIPVWHIPLNERNRYRVCGDFDDWDLYKHGDEVLIPTWWKSFCFVMLSERDGSHNLWTAPHWVVRWDWLAKRIAAHMARSGSRRNFASKLIWGQGGASAGCVVSASVITFENVKALPAQSEADRS